MKISSFNGHTMTTSLFSKTFLKHAILSIFGAMLLLESAAFSIDHQSDAKTIGQDYVFVGDDNNENRFLEIYKYYPNMNKLDDNSVMVRFSKSDLPLQNGYKNSIQTPNGSVSVSYQDGRLIVVNSYRRDSEGRKYRYRNIEWTYEIIVTSPNLSQGSCTLYNGTYISTPFQRR